MFNEQPSYLGGMSTVMQDSMNGVQYGRENVNDGQYVPNQGAQGTVYKDVPAMKKAPKGNSFIQPLVDKYTQGFKAVEFYGLKVPESLVDWKSNPKDWIVALRKHEEALQAGVPLEALIEGEMAFAPLVLEIIQPGSFGKDVIVQTAATQRLRRHLEEKLDIPATKEHQNATRREEELNRNNVQNNLNQVHNQQAPVQNVPPQNYVPPQGNFQNLPHNQGAQANNYIAPVNETPWYRTTPGMIGLGLFGYFLYRQYQQDQL